VSARDLDLGLAETLLNWDTMSHSHGGDSPVPLRKLSVSRREALVQQVRAIQAVAHALMDSGPQIAGDGSVPTGLKVTEMDRKTFNQLVRPLRPEHRQLKNSGGMSYVRTIARETLSPPTFHQIVDLAHLVLNALSETDYRIIRCGYAKCDKGSHRRAKLFIIESDKRARVRYCCNECRDAAKALEPPEPAPPSKSRAKAKRGRERTPARSRARAGTRG